jgi:uncharacterized protein YdcH (DUF465 family)
LAIPINLQIKTLSETLETAVEDLNESPNGDSLINFITNSDNRPEINADANLTAQENAKNIADAAQKTVLLGAQKAEAWVQDLNEFGQNFLPEKLVGEFLTNYHYPKITLVRINPIDLADCIENNYDRLTNIIKNKVPSEIKKYEDFLKEAQRDQNKYEGGLFAKMQADFTNDFNGIQDPNVRALFGLDPPPPDDPKDGQVKKLTKRFNRTLAGLNMIDWPRILAEAFKCSTVEIDPAVLQSLLDLYKGARDFIESALLISVCNPYLTSLLEKINSLNLPILPTVNRKQSLSDALIAQLLKIVNELLILTIRLILKGSIKACITNTNSNFGDNNIEGINNSIDAGLGLNDPSINDLLNDLFNNIKNPDGSPNAEKINEAKEKLKDLLDDIINCLTPEELCKLLLGRSVNDEVYEIIISIVNRRYNTPDASYNIADKLNNNEAIRNLFLKLGSNTGLEMRLCEDLINRANTNNNSLFPCLSGDIEVFRKNFFKNKGLTDDLVSDLLDDIKDKKEKVSDFTKVVKTQEQELAMLYKEHGTLEHKIETIYSNEKEKTSLQRKYAAYELFMRCMHSNGIAFGLIKKNLPLINQEITKILSSVVDFEVFFENSDNKLDIFIKHPKYDARPLENGSGAEKTLAAMAIRIALINVTNMPKPNVFILDEPGTALDNDNMEGFVRILDLVKEYFETTILISHIDQLKDSADMNIEISRNNGYAFVKC